MFFAALLGPILLILAFNTVVFIVVIAVIIKHTVKRSIDHKKKTDTIQLMLSITSVFVLLGLTWIFGAMTIMKAAPTFEIVFTILNSFQGFLNFFFFCVLKKEIRSSWAQTLRGMMRGVSSIRESTEFSPHSVLRKVGNDVTTFTKELTTTGPNARTVTIDKRRMDEVITLPFDEKKTGDDIN